MSTAEIAPGPSGRLEVRGTLDYASVADLLGPGADLFAGRQATEIDLQGVERANSAGLVLLLEWLDRARRSGGSLRFRNLPPSLVEIARLTNSAELLTTEDS